MKNYFYVLFLKVTKINLGLYILVRIKLHFFIGLNTIILFSGILKLVYLNGIKINAFFQSI